jgi:5-methylcytosine-specific restriction endonuclease McrA
MEFKSFPKRGRVRLRGQAFKALNQRVLERDEWTCRRCPSQQNLQVHHIIKRSEIRLDLSWNLVTLCYPCHELVERHTVDIIGEDANVMPPDDGALRFVVRT